MTNDTPKPELERAPDTIDELCLEYMIDASTPKKPTISEGFRAGYMAAIDIAKWRNIRPVVTDAVVSEQAAAIAKLTAALDAMLRELKAATGHDDGLIAIRHLVLRATQAENYITATEESGK